MLILHHFHPITIFFPFQYDSFKSIINKNISIIWNTNLLFNLIFFISFIVSKMSVTKIISYILNFIRFPTLSFYKKKTWFLLLALGGNIRFTVNSRTFPMFGVSLARKLEILLNFGVSHVFSNLIWKHGRHF